MQTPTLKQQIVRGGVLGGIIIAATIWFNMPSDPVNTPVKTMPDEYTICAYAQMAVEASLKSPATADFPVCNENRIIREGDRYIVTSYVDSQNSFGAQVRTPFQVYLQKTGENAVVVTDISF